MFGLVARAQGQSAGPQPGIWAGDPTPTIDIWGTTQLAEFHFFFQHLANLDAVADAKEAEDGTFDASSWRTLDQRAAGLTDVEGTILKEIASGCLQALSDHDAEVQAAAATGTEVLTERTQIIESALEDLQLQLGEETFQTLASYVYARFGSDLEVGISPPGPLPPGDFMTIDGNPSTTAVPLIFTVEVGGLVTKLPAPPAPEVMAECITNLIDDATRQGYPTGVTACTLFSSDGFPSFTVPCNATGQCVGIFTTFPGLTRWTQGVHGLVMRPGQCTPPDGPAFQGLLDPLHFCRPAGALEFRSPGGSVYNLGGEAACWPFTPAGNCALAQTQSNAVTFIDIYPFEVTLNANGQQAFASNLPIVVWNLSGPGSLQGNVYKAPATVTNAQTATVTVCDATPPYLDDCTFATVHLEPPAQVEVTPANSEVLPGGELEFTAKTTPSTPGQTWTWSLSTRPGDPTGTFTPNSEDSSKGTYKAPTDNPVRVVEDVIVKACTKPEGSSEPVCGTAKVFVKPILFYILGSKTVLTLDETVQLTAFVQNSNVPLDITWKEPEDGLLNPVSTADPFVRIYQAPSSPVEAGGADIEACLNASPDFCARYHVKLPVPLRLDKITSDAATRRWQAGTITPFTITGRGWGPPTPTVVALLPLKTQVTSFTETTIQGKVVLPVTAVPTTAEPTVGVEYPNGFIFILSLPSLDIEPATISVAPPTAQLTAGGTQQFGTFCLTSTTQPCTSQEVPSWTASLGTISPPAGLSVTYTAPASVPSNTVATVRACWPSGACAIAQVTLVSPAVPVVTVSPKTVSLTPGQTQRFTAQVTNTTNTAVTWSIQPAVGSIDQTGLYTAPAPFGSTTTVTVTATSQADAARTGTATVTLIPAPLTLTSTPSPASVNSGATITWTATASGGTPGTIQYAFFRRKAGTTTWIPALGTPAWQTSNVLVWTPGSADGGSWEIRIGARDVNTPPNAPVLYDPGPVQVLVPPALTCTSSPASAPYGTTITWTAIASGGVPATTQYALFRKKVGNPDWTPSVSSPAWQASNVLSWTPVSSDLGIWEIIVWVRDGNTPANMNTYGFAAYCNPGPVEVTAPVFQSYAPTGWVDSYDGQHIRGWACDPDYPTESNRVDIWTTSWQYLGSADAYYGSSAAINSACGGGWAHYFDFYHNGSIAPGTHFMVWSIDWPYNTPGNINRPIGGFGSIGDGTEFVMPVFQSYAPIGWVDGFDRQHIWGWACDPDFPNESNRVDIYTTGWQYLGSVDASYGSSAAINSVCNGGWAHYFDFYHYGAIPPGTHFMVWSIDLPYNTPGNVNRPIGGFGSIGDGTEFVLP